MFPVRVIPSKHRYVFCLARQSSEGPAPSASDFPKPSSSRAEEDIKDRAGFSLETYVEDKSMSIVAITFIKVGPDAEGLVENAKLSGEAILNKITGQ